MRELVVAGTSPLPWNIGPAWRLTDLSHTALPHSCLELSLWQCKGSCGTEDLWKREHPGSTAAQLGARRQFMHLASAGGSLCVWQSPGFWRLSTSRSTLFLGSSSGFGVFSHFPFRHFISSFPIGWHQFVWVRLERFPSILSSAAWVIHLIFSGREKTDVSSNWMGKVILLHLILWTLLFKDWFSTSPVRRAACTREDRGEHWSPICFYFIYIFCFENFINEYYIDIICTPLPQLLPCPSHSL